MSNDQSNVQLGTNPDRVGQQISLHQSDGDTSTWVTMIQSSAPITANAFTTAAITINTYAGTAIKINVIDPPTGGPVANLLNFVGSEIIDVDTTEEVEESDSLFDYNFRHVYWTPAGYVEDNLSAVGYETAVESQPDVESDSSDEGEPWSSSSDDSDSDDSDEGEDEDDNRSTTAEIGEPTENNVLTSDNYFILASHLRPISNYPYLPTSTDFVNCAIDCSRKRWPAFQRSFLCQTSVPFIGSRPLYSWHWPDVNGRVPVPDWDYVLVCMREHLLVPLSAGGITTRRSDQDEFLNVNIGNNIDVQLDFSLPEAAGYRVLAWAKKPLSGGDWYWFDIQGRVVRKSSYVQENQDPSIHVST